MKKIMLISILIILVLAVTVAAESKLEITDIEAEIDGDEESVSLTSPNIDVQPDVELKLKITVENKFTSEEDLEIQNIKGTAELKDIDDGSDVSIESSEFDLDPGDDKTVTFEFEIPIKLDDDEYDLDIEFEGEDENDTDHSDKISIEVKVDKDTHDVRFSKKEFTTETLICDRDTIFLMEAINVGNEEEDVTITLKNLRLGVQFEDKVRLDEKPSQEDNTFQKEYEINLPAAIQGTYTFELKASYGSKFTKEEIPLYIHQCDSKITSSIMDSNDDSSDEEPEESEQSSETGTSSTTEQLTRPAQDSEDETTSASTTQQAPATEVKQSFGFDKGTAIIVLEIIVIVVGVFMIVMLNRK